MELITTYFWLMVPIPWVAAAAKGRRNAAADIELGLFSQQQINTFFLSLALWVAVPSVFFWLIGAPPAKTSPIGTDILQNNTEVVFIAVAAILNLLLAGWIWLKNGAEILVKYCPYLNILPGFLNKENTFKALSLLLVIQVVFSALEIWS